MTTNAQKALDGAERARKDLEASSRCEEMPGGAQAVRDAYSGACCRALLAAIAADAARMDVVAPDHDAGVWVSFAGWLERKYGGQP